MVTAHCLVKNEENFVWYSVVSVIEFVDEIFIWDTGSSDKTLHIIKELVKEYPKKINFKEVGNVDKREYSAIRQQMLDETKPGWVFILDGDEIYFQSSIQRIVSEINSNKNKYESMVVPTINLVGDMFHYQESVAGKYKFGNKTGHYALRFINTSIPGLHVYEEYGKEGFADINNRPIQDRDENKIAYLDAPYLHATHLLRSSKDDDVMQRSAKRKYELGIEFMKDFYYPEVFFKSRPQIVPNVWKNMDFNFKLRAFIETPLRKLKRRFL